jgi:hypothetical protein
MEKQCDESIAWMREMYGDEYSKNLESIYVATTMNWQFTLDEIIRLRRENRELKDKLDSFDPAPTQ